jgi:hypothetical protein
MEALGGAASIIAVVQISEKILTLCGTYASAVKNAKADIGRLQSEVATLLDVLKILKGVAEDENTDETKLSALKTLGETIQQCHSELQDIGTHLNGGIGRRFGIRAIKWPFKSNDVNKVIATLERHKTTIDMALNISVKVDLQVRGPLAY